MKANNRYKSRQPIGSTLDQEIYNKLKEYSDETKIPMSKVLDKALEQFFNSLDKK